MLHTVESIASTRKKTKETVRIESLFPDELRENSKVLIDLLKDYYEHMNERGMPSYEIDSINEVRDIDSADYEYLDLIQREIAFSVPRTVVADKVKLYKNLMRYYTIRGSTDSVELFFKILFSDNVEVYYPREDMLVPSSGTWDTISRRPAKVKLFDQKQLMKFSVVLESVTGSMNSFTKGETVTGSEIGVTAIVDSYVGDVLTLKGIRIPAGYDPSLTNGFIKGETVSGNYTYITVAPGTPWAHPDSGVEYYGYYHAGETVSIRDSSDNQIATAYVVSFTDDILACRIITADSGIGTGLTGADSVVSSRVTTIQSDPNDINTRHDMPGENRSFISAEINSGAILSIYQDGNILIQFELADSPSPGFYTIGERITGSVSESFATVTAYNSTTNTLVVKNPSGNFNILDQLVGEDDNRNFISIYTPGKYLDSNGFLSDIKKLQDSYFYQQFSYVIRTGQTVSAWRNEFNRLVHPAGFIFFGEVLILLKLLNDGETYQVIKQNRLKDPETGELLPLADATDVDVIDPNRLRKWLASKMTKYQPGLIGLEDIPLLVLSQVIRDINYIITAETLSDNAFFIPGEIVVGQTSGVTAEVQMFESIKYYTTVGDQDRIGTEIVNGETLYVKRKYGHTVLRNVSANSLGIKDFYEGETLIGQTSGTSKVITSGIQSDAPIQTYYLDLSGSDVKRYRPGEYVTLYDGETRVARAKVRAYNYTTKSLAIEDLDGTITSADSIEGQKSYASHTIDDYFTGAYRTMHSGKATWDWTDIVLILQLVAQNSNQRGILKSNYSNQVKFFDETPISDYSDYVIGNDINNSINWNNVGSSIELY
jgi:hypothetical protein